MITIETKSVKETREAARYLAGELRPLRNGAAIIALAGELGSGKTVFVQGFARALGVKDSVLSPTFILMKIYPLKKQRFRHLVHIDCYRVKRPWEMIHLGLKEFLKDRDAVILIEWADRIKDLIPRGALWIQFSYGEQQRARQLKIQIPKPNDKI